MKKYVILFASLFAVCSCGGNNNYSFERIWEDTTIYNESCVMIEHDDGYYGELLYEPTKIVEVKNYTQEKTYASSEYKLEGRRLYKTVESSFPVLSKDNISCVDVPENIGETYPDGKGGNILFTEGTGLVSYQVLVTYKHKDKWYGSVPQKRGNELPALQEKLNSKQTLTYVTYGDSIFAGCNASGMLDISPHQDIFPLAFKKALENKYNLQVNYYNEAVPRTTSSWGAENVNNLCTKYHPDLAVIGFGMNDSTTQVSGEEYYANMKQIVDSIKEDKNDCGIILCATIYANPDTAFNNKQEEYLSLLNQLACQYENVTVLDMTTFSKDLLKYKSSFELYANNINHPNDFLSRCYVSNLLNVIEMV